ncbi:MAG: hypothetical protein WAO69_00095 [Aestuariivita sp.]|uniref:hypothetical protein n=1 Tax=Aestuariivita sp. TaxID=1872407 RepID=UPI003BAEAC74
MDDQLKQMHDRIDVLAALVRGLNAGAHDVDHRPALEELSEEVAGIKAVHAKLAQGVTEKQLNAAIRNAVNQLPDIVVPPIKTRIDAVEKIATNAAEDAAREATNVLSNVHETLRKSLNAHELRGVIGAQTIRRIIAEELE